MEDFGSVAFSVETVVPAPQFAEVYIFKSPCAVQFAMYCTITAELVRGIFFVVVMHGFRYFLPLEFLIHTFSKSPSAVKFAMYCTITAELVREIFLLL